MENKPKYRVKTNHIINKLMRKICNGNTPLNTTFNWFNKYKVTLQSGCRDFTAVYVTSLENHPKTIAQFDIDFSTKKLTINNTHSEDEKDFIIADSLIKTFGDIYRASNITIDDTDVWKELYLSYKEILSNSEDYVPEFIKEAENIIKLYDKRLQWIEWFSGLVK